MNSEETLRVYKLDEKERFTNSKLVIANQDNLVLNVDQFSEIDHFRLEPEIGPYSTDVYEVGSHVQVIPMNANGNRNSFLCFSNEVEVKDVGQITYADYLGAFDDQEASEKELNNFKKVLSGIANLGSKSHLEEKLFYEDFHTLSRRTLEYDRNVKGKLPLTKRISEYLVNTLTNYIPDSIANKLLSHYDDLDKKARDNEVARRLFLSFS